MEVLFVFLRWVGTFSYRDEETGSRMDMANLATVICPSILYAKGANAARDESFIAIEAVQDLLENQDEYYRLPNELMFVIDENIFSIFAKELDLPPKEIHRHCSKYMQARMNSRQGQGYAPGAPGPIMRERPSDPRLGSHRGEIINSQPIPYSHSNGSSSGQYRQNVASGTSRPTSWAQMSQPGSQQSLHQTLNSPGSTPFRGPFQGSANGSRNSSRGSAPSSPGPDAERPSFHMDRERSWTPVLPSAQIQEGRGRGG